jgi:tetratricopeptide (TPR) repeat protein
MRNILTLFIGSLFFITSCKTSFRISVKEPAVIAISDSIEQFGVVNNVTKMNSPEEVAGSLLGGNAPNANITAAERAVDGIFRALDRSDKLHGITFETNQFKSSDGQINWAYIDSAAKANGLDGFIEIAELRTVSPVGGSVMANMEGKSRTYIDGTAYVNYYIANEHISHERMVVRYRHNIRLSEGNTVFDILNDVKKKQEQYRALGFELGYKAGKLIYPNWVWANRKYYNKGSKELKRAKPMIHKGNWDIAEKQLEYGLDNHKEKVRGRICYNLALVNEGQGEIDKAIEYAERAALEYGDKMANDYLVILRERKRQLEQIKLDQEK